MLELQALSKRFGTKQAVRDVSLAIAAGELVGVIGRSGAGKSTLLRMINRLVEPSAGQVVYGGADVTRLRGAGLRQWRARCAMIFQQFNLVKRLDVLTNVLIGRLAYRPVLPSLLKRFTPAERALAVAALDRVDIADVALQRADTLSGGQQQRVAIARALVQQPRLILADEPIASLDPESARRVMEILADINRADGITIVVSLHQVGFALRYCRRVVALKAGRVVFDGATAAVTPAMLRAIYGAEADLDFTEVEAALPDAPPRLAGALAAG